MKQLIGLRCVSVVVAIGGSVYSEECKFDKTNLSFEGSAVDQAKCLLRPVKTFGKLGDPVKDLPTPLATRIGTSVSVDRGRFQKYLEAHGIRESEIGGSLGAAISRSNDGNPQSDAAKYFVIHDTSAPNLAKADFPQNINSAEWTGNDLSRWKSNAIAHVFVNRVGESITTHDFSVPWRATKFETSVGKAAKGLFLHVELVQPRRSHSKGKEGNDAEAPVPGFTEPQLERLALIYVAASHRAGTWLIPAFHCVLDAGLEDGHDDPQNFGLDVWAAQIEEIARAIGDR